MYAIYNSRPEIAVFFILPLLQKDGHKLIRIDYINAHSLIPGCGGSFSVFEVLGEQPFIVNLDSHYLVHRRAKGGG